MCEWWLWSLLCFGVLFLYVDVYWCSWLFGGYLFFIMSGVLRMLFWFGRELKWWWLLGDFCSLVMILNDLFVFFYLWVCGGSNVVCLFLLLFFSLVFFVVIFFFIMCFFVLFFWCYFVFIVWCDEIIICSKS